MLNRLDLHRKKAENCLRCQNTEERKRLQDSNGYCKIVKPSDNLGIRCVGGWGADKVVFVSTYVNIAGNAMKNIWSKQYYIEICSGPGLCVDFDSGEEFDGTALAVLQVEGAKYFSKLFFFDINQNTIQTLRKRIDRNTLIPREVKENTVIEEGDYSNPESIVKVLDQHISENKKGLYIVFVDPTDLSVPFDLYIAIMKFGGNIDFIINFADGTDLRRNIKRAFDNPNYQVRQKYNRVLKQSDFFTNPEHIRDAEQNNFDKLSSEFEIAFLNSFKDEGYVYIQDKKNIKWYYKLLYLSKSSKGMSFWCSASEKTAAEREYCQPVLSLFEDGHSVMQ